MLGHNYLVLQIHTSFNIKKRKNLYLLLLKSTAMNCQKVQRLINTDGERKYGQAEMSYLRLKRIIFNMT